MFETTAVDSKKRRTSALFVATLPFSIILHVLIGVGALAITFWDIDMPGVPPPTNDSYFILEAVPVPPPPPPPPPPPAKAAEETPKPTKLPDGFAPTAIADEIPVLEPEIADNAQAGTDGGVAGGIEGGETGGVVGGTPGGLTMEPPKVPDVIVIPRDEHLPLKVLSQNYPMYPDKWLGRRIESVVVLRYMIDKKGHVSKVEVIQASPFPEFNKESVNAIRSWRFQPLVIAGEPKEVIHELTIYFKLERPEPRKPRPASKTTN